MVILPFFSFALFSIFLTKSPGILFLSLVLMYITPVSLCTFLLNNFSRKSKYSVVSKFSILQIALSITSFIHFCLLFRIAFLSLKPAEDFVFSLYSFLEARDFFSNPLISFSISIFASSICALQKSSASFKIASASSLALAWISFIILFNPLIHFSHLL